MNLLAIDPGLATTGFALFQIPSSGIWPENHDPIRNLSLAWERETDPENHLALRLYTLHSETRAAMVSIRPAVVVIETPATGADYGGQKGRRTGANLLYEALGVIQAAVAQELSEAGQTPDSIHYVKAPAGKKTERHQKLKERSQRENTPLPTGPRGGKLPNAWDAITCGLTFLERSVEKGG